MSSILRGLNENVQIEENSSAELTAKLDKVESILGTRTDMRGRQFNQAIQDITKNVKYLQQDELVMEIYSKIRDIAEAIGLPEKELEYAEDDVRKAFNNLESAVYNLEEPFEDYIRDLQYKVEELEDIDEGQRCWKGYKKKGTKKMFGKTVNNCVKATESEEVDEAMDIPDQDAFDNIFKDRKAKPRKPKHYDNHPTKRSPRYYDSYKDDFKRREMEYELRDEIDEYGTKLSEFQRGSFDDDKPKRPKKGKLVTKDGTPVTLPLRTQDFRGDEMIVTGYKAPHKYGSTGRIYTDDGMSYFPSVANLKIIDHDFSDDMDESKKSGIGKVMEMYDDILYLMYIDGKLAMPTPIEKKDMNKYERLIKNVLPGSDIQFKGTPRHYYSSEELAEGNGNIRKALAGIILLGGLLGLNNHQAQKIYDQSHQLQQLTQVYMVAKERGDEAKMKDVKRRIGNHKMRLDLGKGDVDFDGRPGKDDIKDIDYINTPGEK